MPNYGIPYQGSKSRIINEFAHLFPKATHFYDLFGGGFSVTHFMLQKRFRDYTHFHFNEIRPGICELIQKAIKGEFDYARFKMPWISREEFVSKKESDAFMKIIWSFGNNGRSYLFGRNIEEYKKPLHQCVMFDEFDTISEIITGLKKWPANISVKEKRLFIGNRIKCFIKTKIPEILHRFIKPEQLQQLQQFLHLERLQQLEQLQQLQQLERLNFYTEDYKSVIIEPDSIIYCDIPYLGTRKYVPNLKFDHKGFFDWAAAQSNPVFISEYNISDSRFKLIKSMESRSKISVREYNSMKVIENIYINRSAFLASSLS